MAVTFKYVAYHPVARYQIAPLSVREPQWTEALAAGSTLTFKVTVPDDPIQIARIKEATKPDGAAIYVEASNGAIPWGGVVKKRSWDANTSTYSVTVLEWRSWLYSVYLSPKTDLSGDTVLTYSGVDQFVMARGLINALPPGIAAQGTPPILMDAALLSGVSRSATFRGTAFQPIGTLIDSIANLSNGFDWTLEIIRSPVDALPILRFVPYYPQRGGLVPTLLFKYGSTMVSIEGLEESSENRASRQWAVGEGPNAESLPYAVDIVPAITGGRILRVDRATQYQGVYSRTTLASYARSERLFREVDLDVISFMTTIDAPDVLSYAVGDRGRVIYSDRIYRIDVATARVIERTISPNSNQVKVTVDLSDLAAPEVDPGGSV